MKLKFRLLLGGISGLIIYFIISSIFNKYLSLTFGVLYFLIIYIVTSKKFSKWIKNLEGVRLKKEKEEEFKLKNMTKKELIKNRKWLYHLTEKHESYLDNRYMIYLGFILGLIGGLWGNITINLFIQQFNLKPINVFVTLSLVMGLIIIIFTIGMKIRENDYEDLIDEFNKYNKLLNKKPR
jgi:uncharacterized membrane protein YfcA